MLLYLQKSYFSFSNLKIRKVLPILTTFTCKYLLLLSLVKRYSRAAKILGLCIGESRAKVLLPKISKILVWNVGVHLGCIPPPNVFFLTLGYPMFLHQMDDKTPVFLHIFDKNTGSKTPGYFNILLLYLKWKPTRNSISVLSATLTTNKIISLWKQHS